ncbi:MAG: hypothetical protein QM570_18320 [Planctomycetota bacterium]|jgi:hypothetical protein|nr:hypothetical protein [Planctomycetota bacterium]
MLGITERTEIRDIGNDPQVVEAAELRNRLEAEHRRVRERLARCSGPGPCGPTLRHDGAADAESLLRGTPVSDLTSPVQETERATLLRQLHALERAVPSAKNRVQQIRRQAELSEVSRLRPVLASSYRDVLSAFESLLFTLREHNDLLNRLHQHGISYDALTIWRLTPRESVALFGGSDSNLETYLRIRREATGLDGERE